VALFALSENLLWSSASWLHFFIRYTPPGDADSLVTARIKMLPQTDKPPILLLGSSQIREGLDCAVFEERLSGRVCGNLAISAASPLDILYISKKLDGRVPKRVTITGLFPKVLHVPPKSGFTDAETVRLLLRGGAAPRMSGKEWMDVVWGLIQNLSDTLRTKDSLWAAYGNVRGDLARALRYEIPPQPSRVLEEQERQPPEYFESRMNRVSFEGPTAYTAVQDAALEVFIARESQRGNLTLVVDFPTRPGYETTLSAGAAEHYRALIKRLSRRKDIVLLTRHDLPALAVEDFLDFTHLADSGRARVSVRLAQILARLEGGAPPEGHSPRLGQGGGRFDSEGPLAYHGSKERP